jgi:hypothetical protein
MPVFRGSLMSFRYILRYYIDPGFQEDDRIIELLEFCHDGKVEEVMFFSNPEELYCGYPDQAESEKWFCLANKVKKALNAHGIDMSVNPWATTGHLSRGRKFGIGQQKIQPMVGENGIVSPITACPLEPEWQEQLGDFFAAIAKRVAPTAIWVEDDWRLHNHEPEMNFGGCCCPLHLKRFSDIVGKTVSREELLSNVLAPGKPHPWRSIWLDLWRDTMLEPAKYLENRVHMANPDVELALMSSVPDIHSVEGRDWTALSKTLSPQHPLQLRPHLPPYTETRALTTTPSVTRQTIAYAPAGTVIYPELENSPRCGRYSKSARYSAWECLHSACYGSRGITINHFDMMGNGIALDRTFGRMLSAIKPRLDALSELNLDDRNAEGVDILALPEVSRHADSSRRDSFFGLNKPSQLWSDVFYLLGISHRITTSIAAGRVIAVSGQTMNALPDETLRQLLSGQLMLDAEAAEILLRRGFGEFTGVRSANWRTLNDSGYAYEEILSDDIDCYGLSRPRMSAQRCSMRLWVLEPADNADVLTMVHRFDHKGISPGMLKFRNKLGGKIITLAYPLGEGQFFVGFFNNFRRRLFQKLITGFDTSVAMGEEFPMHVYRCRHAKGTFAAFINSSLDDLEQVEFKINHVDPGSARILTSDGKWEKADLQIANGRHIAPLRVPALDALFLNFQ